MKFTFFNNKAQGTIEYLVIISIVVVIGLIVVSLLISQVDASSDVTNTSGEISSKIGVGGLSLGDSVAGVDENGLLVIKNIGVENLTLSKIIIDGIDHNFSTQIVANDEKSFKLQDIASCVGEKKSYSVKVEYVSASGLTKVADFGNISLDCTSVVTPVGIAVEEEPSVPVGHFCGELSPPAGYTLISSCDSIGSAGNYILTQNLTCPSELIIAANDVNINGNYCTITGNINASRSGQDESGYGYSAYTDLNLNNIIITGTVSSNGAGAVEFGGNGGNITITENSITGTVSSNGGTGNYYGGSGGMINIIASNTGAVSSNGANAVEIGGNGGNITITENSITSIVSSNGGIGDLDRSGNGGSISISGTLTSVGNCTANSGDLGCCDGLGGNGGNITINNPCPNLTNIGEFTCTGVTSGSCPHTCS